MAAIIQKALHTCSEHEHEEIDLYCKTCKKPVCVKCVRNEHKEHDWDSMKNVAKSLRVHTKQRKLEIQSVSKSCILGVSEMLDFVSSRFEKEVSSNCSALEATRKRLQVTYVNTQIDRMKDKCEKNHEAKTQKVKEIRDKLATKESRINLLIQEMETGASDFTDFDLIEMHDELQQVISEVQSLTEIPRDLHASTLYNPGSPDVSEIASSLGSVEIDQSLAMPGIKRDFRCKESFVLKICPISANKAWIDNSTTELKLLNLNGNVDISVNIHCTCNDFDIYNGIIYFTAKNEECVKKFYREEIKEVFSTHPFVPYAICLSRSGDIVVGLVGEKVYQDGGKKLQCLVRRMTYSGRMIKEYELENVTIKSLPACPWRIVEHPNSNICILLLYRDSFGVSELFSTLYCVDFTGKTIFKYGDIEEKLMARNFCIDLEGNIFIPDAREQRVHVIDSNGKFVRYIHQQRERSYDPGTIALFDNKLWFGAEADT